jgi:hypothetical protein
MPVVFVNREFRIGVFAWLEIIFVQYAVDSTADQAAVAMLQGMNQ